MASPKGLAKSLNAFVEDAKTVVTGTKTPSSGADQAVTSSSTDCTASPTSPASVEESEENKAYVRGYNDALKDIPLAHGDSPVTVNKDEDSEAAPENDASQGTELRDSASEDGNLGCKCGHYAEEDGNDLDSSPISPEEYERLIPVVTNKLLEAISLPIPLEEIPCRGGTRASLADIREAIMTVLIQRGLRELGEEVVCTPVGQDDMGIDEGDLTSSLKLLYEGIYDQEVAKMVRAIKNPVPIPGISLLPDEVRQRLVLEFRERCWGLSPFLMRARWENDPKDIGYYRTYEVVVESLGGRPASDLSYRDSSRLSGASERERRADERRPLDLGSSKSWTREGENGILGRQRFSGLRDFTSRQWDLHGETLSQDRTPRLGDLRGLSSSSFRDDRQEREFRDASRDLGFGGGLGLGSRLLSRDDDFSDVQEARGSRFGGQIFGRGLSSRLRSRSRDNDFSDAQESRGLRFGGRFGDGSVAQANPDWGTSGGLRMGSRLISRDDDFNDAQEYRGQEFGVHSGSGLRPRRFANDYPDAQEVRDFSPRDRERYNDLMGCRCGICLEARRRTRQVWSGNNSLLRRLDSPLGEVIW